MCETHHYQRLSAVCSREIDSAVLG